MNDRERWIVYPLLFLALGVSLRNQFVDRSFFKTIICQELVVGDVDEHGQEHIIALIGSRPATADAPSIGVLEVSGNVLVRGNTIVDGEFQAKSLVPREVILVPSPQNRRGGSEPGAQTPKDSVDRYEKPGSDAAGSQPQTPDEKKQESDEAKQAPPSSVDK